MNRGFDLGGGGGGAGALSFLHYIVLQVGLFNVFAFLALWSHIRAMTTNPGNNEGPTFESFFQGF